MGSGLALDVRAAARGLVASRAISLTAVLTLALAMGAMIAIFSVANALVLRPLPVTDPQRLATITSDTALRFGFQAGAGWSYAMWDQLRQRAEAFDGAFAWTIQTLDLSQGGEMQPVEVLFASADFFSTLGVRATLGRTFTAADDVRGGGPDGAVAVISHDLWQRRFNGATTAVGSRLSVEGTPLTIVGVAPRRFRGVDVGQPFDIAIPLGAEPLIRGRRSLVEDRRILVLTVMVRLKSGQGISGATAALRAMQPQIVGPGAPPFLEEPFLVVPASRGISDRSRLRQQYQRPLITLSIVAGLVLLIVSVNIGHVFLARATARRQELSVRLAVGAPRWRLARQLFVEGLMLATISAVAGTLIAAWASRALVAYLPATGAPTVIDLPIDWRVLTFAIGVTVAAAVLFAAAPALYATRVPSLEAVQEAGRGAGGRRTGLLSSGAVVTQVALSLVLLAAAGVFARTLERLADVPLGFDPKGVLVITVNAARSDVDPATRLRLYERISEAVAAVPGVTRAAGSIWTPVGTGGGGLLTDARGRRADVGPQVAFNFITPRWFATYGTAFQTGRDFDARDGTNAARVAIVNETLYRRLLHDRGAEAATIDAGPCRRDGCTVVGVVADTVYGRSLRDPPPPTMYVPLAQSAGLGPPHAAVRVSVRASGDSARLIGALTEALRGVDPRLTFSVSSLAREVKASVAQERLVATLAGFFGAIGLLLSAVGLYGVTWYAISRRRAEIGIRLALGAQPSAVVRVMLARIVLFVGIGTAVGVFASLWLSRFVAPLLYGVEPRDAATLAGSAATLASVAALAAWIPAWRATRIDPARVLREH